MMGWEIWAISYLLRPGPAEVKMKRVEYKHVRMRYGFKSVFSKAAFDAQLMGVLKEMGDQGWELKSSFHEGLGGLHVHLIFGRCEED